MKHPEISRYILDLLRLHEQVELPGMGSFEKRLLPAAIHPVEHRFSPPGAEVSFGYGKVAGSGLLLNAIQTQEGISAADAVAKIREFVEDVSQQLAQGNRVHLSPLGTLKLGLDGQYILELQPGLNLNSNSFGLAEFISPAIQRHQEVVQAVKPGRRKSKLWIPAASLLLLAGLGFGAWQLGLIDQLLKPAKTAEVKTVTPEPTQLPPSQPADTISAEPADTTQSPEIVNEAVSAIEPAPSSDEVNGKWVILAACFSSEKNARRHVEKLSSEGHPASIEGQTRSGLYRVSYRSFSTEEAANIGLREIQKTNPKAYIVKLY
jgi:cell division septation protein DedD